MLIFRRGLRPLVFNLHGGVCQNPPVNFLVCASTPHNASAILHTVLDHHILAFGVLLSHSHNLFHGCFRVGSGTKYTVTGFLDDLPTNGHYLWGTMITGVTVPRYSRAMVDDGVQLPGPEGAVMPLAVKCSQPQSPLQYEATGCEAQPETNNVIKISVFILQPYL